MSIKRIARRKAKEALSRLGCGCLYQDKRGTEARWALIAGCLSRDDRSVLDLGCNVGEFTSRCARRGLFALGLDKSKVAIAGARRRFARQNNLAFGLSDLDPATLESLPKFDVCLCLSVAHYWYRDYGAEQCRSMLATLVGKSGKFIFEPASIHSKYGKEARLTFVENDEDSIRSYFTDVLTDIGRPARHVAYLGQTPCLGKEKFRLMFVVD